MDFGGAVESVMKTGKEQRVAGVAEGVGDLRGLVLVASGWWVGHLVV